MSSSSDQKSQAFGHNVSDVERDFKRLKVDEKERQTAPKGRTDHSFNYFALKSSPYSPKISSTDKRQSVNGFRRQRLHLSSKSRTDLPSKSKSNDETKHFGPKEPNVYKDFSDLRPSDERNANSEESKALFFKRDFKSDSTQWRASCEKRSDKKCNRSDPNSSTESNGNRLTHKKLRFNEDKSCARQAMDAQCDASVDELAAYLDDTLFLPRKMSFMAEMMYT